jgi:hypothetical protein
MNSRDLDLAAPRADLSHQFDQSELGTKDNPRGRVISGAMTAIGLQMRHLYG